MNNKKKLMILGASYTQTPLYEAARRMGVETVAASIPGDYPGFALADETAYANIADPEDVLEKAQQLGIDGICTCGLDLGMAAIGLVSEKMGIPGPGEAAGRAASEKWAMKQAFMKAGVQTAKAYCVSNEEELEEALAKLSYPVMLKATDQMGSRGIYRCDSREDVRTNWPLTMAATKKAYCLVEEFIEGELFGTEAMVQNGEIVFIMPDNTEGLQVATVTPVGHSVPLRDMDKIGPEVIEQVTKGIRALGLDNCPVNCDLIRRGDHVYIVEMTGRSGATGLSEIVSAVYGVDYYEMIIRVALGMEVGTFFEKTTGYAALSHTLISRRSGILSQIRNNNRWDPDIIDLSFNVEPGDEIHAYTNGRDRIGQVFLKGKSLAECEAKLNEILGGIRVELEGDLPIIETPLQEIAQGGANRIFVKRDDMLPFSFGGNKVRFAQAFFEDMERTGSNGMVIYGNYHSNLCRIFSVGCQRKGIPCSMVYNTDDTDAGADSLNARLIRQSGVKVYPCTRANLADTVQQAIDDMTNAGLKPYYIYGNRYGEGNEWVPMQTYVDVFAEIRRQERELGLKFDYIFSASSTNMTISGLAEGSRLLNDRREIIGISVSRNSRRAGEVINKNMDVYEEIFGVKPETERDGSYYIDDTYLGNGYGSRDENVDALCAKIYAQTGIAFDNVYSGKGLYGMFDYLEKHGISGKNVLFIHTGGIPVFFEEIPQLFR